jgi:hypothetical protein
MTAPRLYRAMIDGFAAVDGLTLDEASSWLELDPTEIVWAIEQYGLVTTLDDNGSEVVLMEQNGAHPSN